MINCSKYAQQCQNGIFKKMCTLFSYVDLSSILCKYSKYVTLIPDAGEFKNRYVKANINLWLIKIIVNISLKLICKEKIRKYGFPTVVLCKSDFWALL